MAIPFFYPFKTRILEASTTSTAATVLTVVVPHRGRLDSVNLSVGMIGAQTGAASVDFIQVASGFSTAAAILGTTISGMGTVALGAAVTTTTGGSFNFVPTASTFVNPGDLLTLSATGCVGPNVAWVIKEF